MISQTDQIAVNLEALGARHPTRADKSRLGSICKCRSDEGVVSTVCWKPLPVLQEIILLWSSLLPAPEEGFLALLTNGFTLMQNDTAVKGALEINKTWLIRLIFIWGKGKGSHLGIPWLKQIWFIFVIIHAKHQSV